MLILFLLKTFQQFVKVCLRHFFNVFNSVETGKAAGTYIHHGMNTDLANDFGKYGFKGYMLGVNYTFAKNIVAAVEYSDFDAKDNYSGSKPSDKTIWSEVVFTF